jgi:hypothetical protein
VNNTVIKNPVNVSEKLPYISIENHDNGTLSSGNIVRNNLASSYYQLYGCVADHNITITDYDSSFVDYINYNFHLKPGSPAIDQGIPDNAPSVDIEGNSRPYGNGYDVGAYEYKDQATGIIVPDTNVKESQFFLYPNPAIREINIKLKNGEAPIDITILNIDGKIISKRYDVFYEPIYINDLPKGIYFAKVQQFNDLHTLKFLKQ